MNQTSGFLRRIGSKCLFGLVVVILIGWAHPGGLRAQVIFDGSLGSHDGNSDGTVTLAERTLAGDSKFISDSRGQPSGSNLFHSFHQFDLSTGQTATFDGDGYTNVLARVTNGSRSSINGTIRSNNSSVNLFLLNPAGVLFGADAKLENLGSFTATTADRIDLTDTGFFLAAETPASSFTSASIESFGFGATSPSRSIEVNGLRHNLAIPNKIVQSIEIGSLNFVAGSIELVNSEIDPFSGQVHLVAAKPGSIVPANLSTVNVGSFGTSERIRLRSGSKIDFDSGGRVLVRGGKLELENASVISAGESVDVKVAGELRIDPGSTLNTRLEGGSSNGLIQIAAASVRVEASDTDGNGRIGSDFHNLGTYRTAEEGRIDVSEGGTIRLETNTLALDGGVLAQNHSDHPDPSLIQITLTGSNPTAHVTGVITTETFADDGLPGNIRIENGTWTVTPTVLNPAVPDVVDSSTFRNRVRAATAGNADGGDIVFNVDTLTIDDGFVDSAKDFRTIPDPNSPIPITFDGNPGRIDVTANQLTLTNSGQLDAGTIQVNANQVFIDGNPETNLFGQLKFNPSGLFSQSTDPAELAGNITIEGKLPNTRAILIDLGTNSVISSQTASTGSAGNITLKAVTLDVGAGATVSTSAVGGSSGNGGAIDIEANSVVLAGEISSSSVKDPINNTAPDAGDAGGVTMTGLTSLLILDGGILESKTDTNGDAGVITVQAQSIDLQKGGIISTASSGLSTSVRHRNFPDSYSGAAGNIDLTANSITINGEVSSTTNAEGSAGDIQLTAATLNLGTEDARIQSASNAYVSVAGERQDGLPIFYGPAGSISLDVTTSTTIHGTISTSAATSGGTNLDSNDVLTVGTPGSITIHTPILDLNTTGKILSRSTGEIRRSNDFAAIDAGTIRIGGLVTDGDIGSTIEDWTPANRVTIGGEISTTTQAEGNAGSIGIRGTDLTVSADAVVSSSSEGGNVLFVESDPSKRAGRAGNIFLNAGTAAPASTIDIFGSVTTETKTEAPAGSIVVKADELDIQTGAEVLSTSDGTNLSSNTLAEGEAGRILLESPQILVSGDVKTNAVNADAGNIDVLTDSFQVFSPSFVESSTRTGKGGQIRVARDFAGDTTIHQILDWEPASIVSIGSVVATDANGDGGQAGDIGIRATTVEVGLGHIGVIRSNFSGLSANGSAGNIAIVAGGPRSGAPPAPLPHNAGTITVRATGGGIRTDAFSHANAGNIGLVGKILDLDLNGGIFSQQEVGGGGTILVGGLFQASDSNIAHLEPFEEVNLTNGGTIRVNTFGGTGGDVIVNANRLTIDRTGNPGSETGIQATAIDAVNSLTGSGAGGSIFLGTVAQTSPTTLNDLVFGKMDRIEIRAGAEITATTSGSGPGGNISIHTEDLLLDGAGTGIVAESKDSGKAGNILLGGRFQIDPNQPGRVTNVNLQAIPELRIQNGAQVSVATQSDGAAGTLFVNVDQLTIEGAQSGIRASSGEDGGTTTVTGKGGNIVLGQRNENSFVDFSNLELGSLSSLTVKDGATIAASAFSEGDGGDITLKADNARLEAGGTIAASTEASTGGAGGSIDIDAQTMTLTGSGTGILARTLGSGAGGGIDLQTGLLDLKDQAVISSNNDAVTASGQAGTIQFGASTLTMVDASEISSRTKGLGDAGNILGTVSGVATLNTAAKISTSTEGSGAGGDITLTAGDLFIDGPGSGIFSEAESTSTNRAGDIVVNITRPDTLSLTNQGTISSQSLGTGNAGSVTINSAGLISLNGGSSITVQATQANGGSVSLNSGSNILLNGGSNISATAALNGGDVTLRASRFIRLTDSSLVAEAGQNGGNIFLRDAVFGLINRSRISANAVQGNGGFIGVSTLVFLANDSTITASSEFGADGEVRIDALSDLSGTQADLDAALLNSDNQLQERCTVRLPGERSSFVLVGRGGLPVMPGRFLPSHQLLPLPEEG